MDNRSESSALDVLGRCNREVGCITSDFAGSLARSLHLINGELINRRIASPQSRLRQLLAHESDDARVLDELFLATLCRPDVSQSPYWQQQLASIDSASDGERQSFFEDLLWGLLTSETFVTNR